MGKVKNNSIDFVLEGYLEVLIPAVANKEVTSINLFL